MALELVAAEGFQDLKDFEKSALRQLREQILGPGYLVPSLMVGKLLSNREIDAVVILDDVLVLLELKHYLDPRIQIDGLSTPILLHTRRGLFEERDNPCRNLAYSAKVLSGSLKSAAVSLPLAGMLIFTHPQMGELVVQGRAVVRAGPPLAQLQPQDAHEQSEYALLGGVIVCRLAVAAQALETLRRERGRRPVKLRPAEIEWIKNAVLGQMTPFARSRRCIGSYIIDDELPAADEAYRLKIGHQDRTDLPVWIKDYHLDILSPDLDAQHEKLLRDAVALSSLGMHPNLPTYQDYHSEGDHDYVVLRREPGHFLRQRMMAHDLTLADRLLILNDILSGLAHIHHHREQGRAALYRDLRPESIFICDDGRALLFNFDCARLPARITAIEQAKGRARRWRRYASHELLNAASPDQVDTPTDIYSWGIVAYELLTDQLPYPDEGKAAYGSFTPLSRFGLAVPQSLQIAVEQALSPSPGQRPRLAQLQSAVQEAIRACR